jgi:phosphatidate cytidylyltransferase
MISRNLTLRILVALVFGPVLLYLCHLGGIPLLILVEILLLLSLWEFFSLTKIKLYLWQKALLSLTALFVPYSLQQLGAVYLFEAIFAAVVLSTLPFTFARTLGDVGRSMAMSLLAAVYLTIGFSSLILIRNLSTIQVAIAGSWLIFLLGTLWIADTAAYFFGWKFGRAKLSAAISPNKTVVGFIGGFAGALLTALIFSFVFLSDVGFLRLIAPALVIALFGQLGDLAESVFKREMEVKDSSRIIPGHGGILDRFDSLVFAAPALYLYLRWIY